MILMIFKRLWRERRTMSILLLSLCLVTAFLALGPLYVRAVAGSEFNVRVANSSQQIFRIDIQNNDPLDDGYIFDAIENTVAGSVSHVRRYDTTNTWLCDYEDITPDLDRASPQGCYRPYLYHEFETLFTLIDGRFAQDTPQQETIDLEVMITAGMTDLNRTYVGQILDLSGLRAEVVGMVEPTIPMGDPFWVGMTTFDVVNTPMDAAGINTRPDISVVVTSDGWSQLANSAIPVDAFQYSWRLTVDKDVVNFANLDEFEASVARLFSEMRTEYPQIYFRSLLEPLITAFRAGVQAAQGPITILSFIVMVLMVYNLITIATLILEQQRQEWAMISSRGGSSLQLGWIQFVSVLIPGFMAFVIGPLLAYGILIVLSFVGPQAEILNAGELGVIPRESVLLSLIAALVAIVALTLPAIPAARKSLLYLQRGISRPPVRPVWARYGLDLLFILLGIAFLLRMYGLSGEGDLGALLRDPAELVRVIGAQSVSGNMSDPFNLAGPVILFAGLALLWMRLFPLLMRGISLLIHRSRGLTMRLALWTVERDPGHYAQLVLLLIGTLALGTASLALSATLLTGARTIALNEVGADVRVQTIPADADNRFDYTAIDGVTASVPLIVAEVAAGRDITLVGVDVDRADQFPQMAETLAPIKDYPEIDLGGVMLPDDTAQIQLDVLAISPSDGEDTIQTVIGLSLVDGMGIPYQATMTVADPTLTGEFQTHTFDLTASARVGPWRLIGVQFNTEQESREFEHTVVLDNLRVITPDEEILLNDFEPDTLERWRWSRTAGQSIETASLSLTQETTTEGTTALIVRHKIVRVGPTTRYPLLQWRPVIARAIPVIVSRAFSENYGLRSGLRRPLEVNDRLTTEFQLLDGFQQAYISSISLTNTPIEISYEVLAVVDSFPLFEPDEVYMITSVSALQSQVNQIVRANQFFEPNVFLLNLREDVSVDIVRDDIDATSGVLTIQFATTRFEEIQREPLSNAITGILFAGFWVSLGLSLIDFAFYMFVTVQRRAGSFGTLQALGWPRRSILYLLVTEQSAFITPALFIGVFIGIGLAYLILPLLVLLGGTQLNVPLDQIILLVIILVAAFTFILMLTWWYLRRTNLNQVMRFGE